ncbi:MAG: hypothetical protein Fur003_6470 [Candidatus Dojkabacteria bacterium]
MDDINQTNPAPDASNASVQQASKSPTDNSPVSSTSNATPSQTATPATPQTPNSTEGAIGTVDQQHPEDLDARWTSWRCMVCDYVYEGQKPLMKCPRCGNENPDKFD